MSDKSSYQPSSTDSSSTDSLASDSSSTHITERVRAADIKPSSDSIAVTAIEVAMGGSSNMRPEVTFAKSVVHPVATNNNANAFNHDDSAPGNITTEAKSNYASSSSARDNDITNDYATAFDYDDSAPGNIITTTKSNYASSSSARDNDITNNYATAFDYDDSAPGNITTMTKSNYASSTSVRNNAITNNYGNITTMTKSNYASSTSVRNNDITNNYATAFDYDDSAPCNITTMTTSNYAFSKSVHNNDITNSLTTDTFFSAKLSADLLSPPGLDHKLGNIKVTNSIRQVNVTYCTEVSSNLVKSRKSSYQPFAKKRESSHKDTMNSLSSSEEFDMDSVPSAVTPKRPKLICLDNYVSSKVPSNISTKSVDDASLNEYSSASNSSTVYQNPLLNKIKNVIPYPIKVWLRDSSDSIISSFIDIIDLSSTSCCGCNYILRLVDPVNRYGHAVVMKSVTTDDVSYSLTRLMTVARYKPNNVIYSQSIHCVSPFSELFPSVKFVVGEHSELMTEERKLFISQLSKWRSQDPNWVTGVAIIQAVTNMLPIPPANK